MLQVLIGKMDVTDAVIPPIQFDDDYESGPVKVDIKLIYQKEFEDIEGKPIRIKAGNVIWFEGFVRSHKNAKNRDYSITAYDPLFNLVKSDEEFVFQNRTATQMMQSISEQYGLPIKEITSIDTIFPIMYFDKNNAQNIFEIYVILLYESKKRTGKKYWIRYEPGGIRIFDWVPPNKVLVLGAGLTEVETTVSVENIKNSVKVVNREKNIMAVQVDNESIKKYGLFTTTEEHGAETEAAAQSHANTTLKLSALPDVSRQIKHVHSIDEPRLWSGDYVYVEDPTKTILGGYYIRKISYQLYKNRVEMSADLAKISTLPNKAYVPPEEKQKEEG